MRKLRLTASRFGQVINRRVDVYPSAILKSFFSQREICSPSIAWGIDMKETAVLAYETMTRLKTQPAGLFINPKYCWLGVTPDRLVYDPSEENSNGLVEIKCPYTFRNSRLTDVELKRSFCSIVDDKISLKRSHAYFYQVLGQMAIAQYSWCDFVVWTTKNIKKERVYVL